MCVRFKSHSFNDELVNDRVNEVYFKYALNGLKLYMTQQCWPIPNDLRQKVKQELVICGKWLTLNELTVEMKWAKK